MFGGAPRVVVPDNLKAAAIRAAFGVRGLPELNRSNPSANGVSPAAARAPRFD